MQHHHGLRLRLTSDPAQLPRDLDHLFSLHEARWRGASRAFTSDRRTFHRDFATIALDRGWLRLWLAEVEGEVVAAWYGFRFGGADSFYQSGRDPVRAALHVGFVLLTHTIREAVNDGQSEYRFLRGAEPYKGRFASRDAPVSTSIIAAGPVSEIAVSSVSWLSRNKAGRRFLIGLLDDAAS